MWNSAAVNSYTGEEGVVWFWLSSFFCCLLETHYKSDGLNQQSIVDHFHMIVTFLEPQTDPSYVESAYKQSQGGYYRMVIRKSVTSNFFHMIRN